MHHARVLKARSCHDEQFDASNNMIKLITKLTTTNKSTSKLLKVIKLLNIYILI